MNLQENIHRIKEMMGINESAKSYINSEMDEIERAVQDLSRDEDIDISVKEVKEKFKNTKPKKLTKSIWSKLENTESNKIEKGDIKSVEKIAKKYNKTDPQKLKKVLESGDYDPPMIIQFGDRYHLVAGNTRLSTAAAMGMIPNVLIVNVSHKEEQNESELTERCWKGYTQKGMKTMFGKRYPNCVKKKK
jgi:alanyl-tRNA synthetase